MATLVNERSNGLPVTSGNCVGYGNTPKRSARSRSSGPLARRPYDFWHAGVSWRLNAGTPAPLVAEWAGHTVEVLLRIYAHCIDGDDERWFGPMEDALGRG